MTNISNHLDLLDRLPATPERRRLRERLGLTQRQIADELGVTSQAVAAWERGVTPGIRHLGPYVVLCEQLSRRSERRAT